MISEKRERNGGKSWLMQRLIVIATLYIYRKRKIARSLLSPLGLELSLKSLHALLQLCDLVLEFLVIGLQLVRVRLLWGAKRALDEVDGVLGLLWLFK